MANEPITTIVGNLVADPELRYLPNGTAAASFTLASTPRKFNRQTNDWEEGETLFMRCSLYREAAENFAASAKKGYQAIAQGKIKSRSFEHNGQQRTVTELDVEDIGLTTRFVTLTAQRANNGQGGQQQGQQQAPWNGQQQPQQGQQQGQGQYQQQGQQQGGYAPQQGQQQAPQNNGWPQQGGGGSEPPF